MTVLNHVMNCHTFLFSSGCSIREDEHITMQNMTKLFDTNISKANGDYHIYHGTHSSLPRINDAVLAYAMFHLDSFSARTNDDSCLHPCLCMNFFGIHD